MKIFICWSGDLSHKIALILKEWLPDVIQTIEPYVSSEDIDKGARWFTDISVQLNDTEFGIICLASENLNADWILFEAGALSKSIDQSKVCPLLIELTPSDIIGPLAQFQACTLTREDMFKLIKTINEALLEGKLDDSKLTKSFNRCWSEFEKGLNEAKTKSKSPMKKPRSDANMLEEILQLSRTISQTIQTTIISQSKSSKGAISLRRLIEGSSPERLYNLATQLGASIFSAELSKNSLKLVLDGPLGEEKRKILLDAAKFVGIEFIIEGSSTN